MNIFGHRFIAIQGQGIAAKGFAVTPEAYIGIWVAIIAGLLTGIILLVKAQKNQEGTTKSSPHSGDINTATAAGPVPAGTETTTAGSEITNNAPFNESGKKPIDSDSSIKILKKIGTLKKQNILSDEEFSHEKELVLNESASHFADPDIVELFEKLAALYEQKTIGEKVIAEQKAILFGSEGGLLLSLYDIKQIQNVADLKDDEILSDEEAQKKTNEILDTYSTRSKEQLAIPSAMKAVFSEMVKQEFLTADDVAEIKKRTLANGLKRTTEDVARALRKMHSYKKMKVDYPKEDFIAKF
jgi:hypothetical protein